MPVALHLLQELPLVGLRDAGITIVTGRKTVKIATVPSAPAATAAPATAQVEMATLAHLLA
jgi:hypothetical protein